MRHITYTLFTSRIARAVWTWIAYVAVGWLILHAAWYEITAPARIARECAEIGYFVGTDNRLHKCEGVK